MSPRFTSEIFRRAIRMVWVLLLFWLPELRAEIAPKTESVVSAPASQAPGNPPAAKSESTQKTNPPPGIKVLNLVEKLPNGQIAYCHITGQSNKFSLWVPDGFSAQTDAENKKVWITRNGASHFITIEISERRQIQSVSAEFMKQRLLAEHPDAQVASEFDLPVDGTEGMGFDLRWTKSGYALGSSTVMVSYPTAEVIFKLTGPVKDGELDGAISASFAQLLRSFQRKNIDALWESRSKVTPE